MPTSWLLLYWASFLLTLISSKYICALIGDWLVYLLVGRKIFKSELQDGCSIETRRHGLQVIICGLSRTGTLSLKQAMDILGFPCFHGMHLLNPNKAKLFLKALALGNHKDWERLLDGYAAIVDFPAACSYKQLMDIYPHAQVILNTRDPNKWYKSFSNTILRATHGYDHAVYNILYTCMHKCVDVALYKKVLKSRPEHKDICITSYIQHIKEVKQHVPAHQLLVFEFGKENGWATLCNFLNVPQPSKPFPLLNDQLSFHSIVTLDAKIYTITLSTYIFLVSCIFSLFLAWVMKQKGPCNSYSLFSAYSTLYYGQSMYWITYVHGFFKKEAH